MNDYIRPFSEKSVIKIKPEPIFVIKSKLISEPQSKLFINVCHSKDVPSPITPFNPTKTYSDIMNNQWEIPIITSPSRSDIDKKGSSCLVFDCIINSDLVETLTNVNNFQLREILVEWCIESVEIRENLMIHRDLIKFPKMKFKGENLPILEIRNDNNDDKTDTKTNDISDFLQMKRDLIDNEEIDYNENGLKALFPTNSQISNKSKSLIEDISDSRSNVVNSKIENAIEKANINFDVMMRKTNNTDKYKLRIEITSELNSSLDIKLAYNESSNELLIENLNLQQYNAKMLKIPLPNFVKDEKIQLAQFKSFFIKNQKKLYILI